MRKTIVLLLALLAAVSCIRENTDGCPACMSLFFELDDPYSAGDFDSDIRNDVELHLFREGLFSKSVTVPYDMIRGGRPYRLRKKCSDRLSILAYAVPSGEQAPLPEPVAGESFYDQFVRMQPSARASEYAPYGGSLYLGTVHIEGGAPDRKSYRVAMTPCLAEVIVLVVADDGFARTPVIGVEGTAAAMRVHDKSTSGAAEVRAGLSYEDDAYTTGTMRILPPQTPEEGLKANLYDDGELLLSVETGRIAAAGKRIVIKIDPGNLTAEITIDGWTYKTQVVTP